nr:hypothetical protein [Tanacetum cinerariifolium]
MYVGGKVNCVDNIDVDLFNVDEVYMFVQDLRYGPKQLMFYHFKMPNKSLDYDDDVELNASVVGNSKRLALGWINEDDVEESSVDKNDNVNVDLNVNEEQIVNVNEEQTMNVDDYTIDDSLLPALQDLFPTSERKYYVRHIHDNMNLIYKGDHYKELLWKCATATIKRGRKNCDLLINNICEDFNRQLLEARDSLVITALEYVKEYLMKRIVIVQKVIEKSQGPLTPIVKKIFNAIKEKKVSSIPCKHAVACIFNMTDNGMQVGFPEDWVHQSMRPCKNRKKSAGDVTEMVKNGKLIRKGGTVTCCKYGQKGHNKRSCKGPSVIGSGSASGAVSVSQTPVSSPQPKRSSQTSASAKKPQRQPQRAASQPASASAMDLQPQRAASQPASASTSAPNQPGKPKEKVLLQVDHKVQRRPQQGRAKEKKLQG